MNFLALREIGYAHLAGDVLEIGGFEHPARLRNARSITRCDRITRLQAGEIFTEINLSSLPEVDVVLDLDADGLGAFETGRFDSVVCCHVLEHLVNPIKALKEIFRVARGGAHIALAVPDKRFTFDISRPLTDWHLLETRYREDRRTPSEDDYLEFVRCLEPQMLNVSPLELRGYLAHLLKRREHLNVWDSDAFEIFLNRARSLLQISYDVVYESSGEDSRFESFWILRKI
jgi:SAM-dependent methyltransferase